MLTFFEKVSLKLTAHPQISLKQSDTKAEVELKEEWEFGDDECPYICFEIHIEEKITGKKPDPRVISVN